MRSNSTFKTTIFALSYVNLSYIEQHLRQFLGQIAEHGTHLPRFVTQEFDDGPSLA